MTTPACAAESADSTLRAVLAALREWVPTLREPHVYRRENEFISDFVFSTLIRHIDDPRRIGIEVAVPQLPGDDRKAQVRKDLVIWEKPRQTCFDGDGNPIHYPVLIMEWKGRTQDLHAGDVEWLKQFTTRGSCRFGMVLSAHAARGTASLHYAMIESGIVGETRTF